MISIVMGSKSDWQTMKFVADICEEFMLDYETKVVSAHRTPQRLYQYSRDLEDRDVKVVIAGAGGAAHLPGMIASMTIIPVLGVPVQSKVLNGIDSLLSIVQMPAGVPVGSLAIGEAGARNAALLAIAILANEDDNLKAKLRQWRHDNTNSIEENL